MSRAAAVHAPRIVVRRARAADLDAIVAMRLALLEMSRANPAYRRLRKQLEGPARDLFARQLAAANSVTLLACAPERPVAMLRCTVPDPAPLLDPPRHAHVSSVFVEPAFRRRGILRTLLRRADAWCARLGVDEMRLFCGVEN
ncbi:MAG: GNAT family N-acetyltransferase, partial [Gemmatimonadaceae bacterium]